jgi:hypothetical protein
MHSKDPNKQSGEFFDAFWLEFERILEEAGDCEAHFEGFIFPRASFNGWIFKAACSFGQAIFTQDVYFSRAIFKQIPFINEVTFMKSAYFSGATFTMNAIFYRATFVHDVDFWGAIFKHNVCRAAKAAKSARALAPEGMLERKIDLFNFPRTFVRFSARKPRGKAGTMAA